MKLKKTTSTTKTHTFLVQVKMSAMDGKKDEVEANNNNNKSVVLETNLDEASTASDSAGGTRRNY